MCLNALVGMENFSCMSSSTNSVTTSYWKLKGEDAFDGYVTAIFFLLFILFGLPWNVLVLVTVVKKKLYRQPSILLLLNLIVTDIAFLVIPVPSLMVTGFAGEYIMGNTDWLRCQTCPVAFETLTLMYNSLFTIVMMSVDRFLYIYKPLQYDRIVSKVWILVPILISWMVSISIGISSRLVGSRKIDFQPVFLACTVENGIYFAITIIVIGFAALVVIVVCNAWIILIVLKNIKLIYANTALDNSKQQALNKSVKKNRHKKQLYLFRTFGALLFSNVIAWLPFISILIALIITEYGVSHTTITVVFVLFNSQSVLHPLIQTICIPDVRESMKQTLTCGLYSRHCWSTSKEKTTRSISWKKGCCDSCFFLTTINAAVLPRNTAITIEKEQSATLIM